MSVEAVRLRTSDGLWLEGRLCVTAGARGGAILCHPYPPAQGSMSSILIPTIQRALEHAGWASLRFNFRGVGRSEGRFEHGVGEEKDALAALELLAERTGFDHLAVIGWSFGAMVGLRAATLDPRVEGYVGVAPPVSESSITYAGPPAERLEGWHARALAVCGTRDPYCRPDAMRAWLAGFAADAEAVVIDGADHAFTGHREQLTDAIVRFLG